MAQRATSLGPKPSLCFVCFVCFCFFLGVFFFCFYVFCFLFFGGGFKGQMRWPKGPPHLVLNPPYFISFLFFCFCFFVFFVFLFFVSLSLLLL